MAAIVTMRYVRYLYESISWTYGCSLKTVIKTNAMMAIITDLIINVFVFIAYLVGALVKSKKLVTPAKAGVHKNLKSLDSCFRRNNK